jgi:hypothetical protein
MQPIRVRRLSSASTFAVLLAAGVAACSAEGEPAPSRTSSPSTGAAASGGGRGPSGRAGGPAAPSGGAGTKAPDFGGSQPGVMPIAGGPSGTAGPGMPGLPEGTCANAVADTAPVTPVIWLVVDGSSSMNQEFAMGRNRWETLRATLMDPGGVVESLQSVAEFGMVIYSGGNSDPNMCTQLVTVNPALNNYAALDAMYARMPLGMGTPTDKALDHVVTTLPTVTMQTLDGPEKPIYVVLATDGQPNDSCERGILGGGRDDATVRQDVIGVTTKATQNGVKMYVISLAGDDANLQSHLEHVAMATESKTPPFVPATQTDLVTTFRDIVGSASCQIDLKGMVKQGQECAGKVTLNGSDLNCGSDDGWRLLDENTFELTGNACSNFTSAASTVFATFPCEVFVPE